MRRQPSRTTRVCPCTCGLNSSSKPPVVGGPQMTLISWKQSWRHCGLSSCECGRDECSSLSIIGCRKRKSTLPKSISFGCLDARAVLFIGGKTTEAKECTRNGEDSTGEGTRRIWRLEARPFFELVGRPGGNGMHE